MTDLAPILAELPHRPGVYLYLNTQGKVIYVGKAIDLFKRVHQYFSKTDDRGTKTTQLVSEIKKIRTIQTTSEFDALLLEAKLIRMYSPKYNAVLKDDKSPLYICLTLADTIPRVEFLRKTALPQFQTQKRNVFYGPLQSPRAARTIMRQLRRIVPYCTQKERNGRPCFYTHIGLCNPCPSYIEGLNGIEKRKATRVYRTNIKKLQAILEGKSDLVLLQYQKAMQIASDRRDYETAHQIKLRLQALRQIAQLRYDPAIFMEQGADSVFEDELTELSRVLALENLRRIECFDISHLSGTAMVGSMVVLIHGKPDNSQYRRFRIQTVKGISDVDAMREVITRRLAHSEWDMPDFVLIDGGKPQIHAVAPLLEHAHIPFAGLAKRFEELIFIKNGHFKTLRLPLTGKSIKVLERIRDEAHRFAITYSRLLRSKQFFGTIKLSK